MMCELKDHLFTVKFYSADDRPSIKGNGFDGLSIGDDKEEANEFVSWVNSRLELCRIKTTEASDLKIGIQRRDARIIELEEGIRRLERAFSHVFVVDRSGGADIEPDIDRCKECGLDIRNDVHPRVPRDEWGRWGC